MVARVHHHAVFATLRPTYGSCPRKFPPEAGEFGFGGIGAGFGGIGPGFSGKEAESLVTPE